MLKTLKKLSAVALAAAAMGIAPAHASTVALADLNVQSIGLYSVGPNNTLIPFSAANGSLSISGEGRTGNASAVYNGVSVSDSKNATGAANVDVAAQCAGNCVGAAALYAGGGGFENNVGTHIPTPGTVNFALGDMYMSGNALGGAVNGLTRADASTAGATNLGSSDVKIHNSGQITGTFSLSASFTGVIGVGADYWVQAFVDSMLPASGFASAGTNWSITITSSADTSFQKLVFKPDELNHQAVSFGTGDNASNVFSDSSFFAASDIRTYLSGAAYNFVIDQGSSVIVSEIPEPGSLALVGLSLGLIGLGMRRRNR